ncbi:hypothetical protein QR680_001531 [Steinernema hermaphroditum]|uniref:Uncharacterized protein n=1 Tax=Steinernema hermaphroditum TaxID=289476 RepID=A0AA39GYQ0_9BILA|nr:hypothetical protein QR680_001531 [Steinernema hermaphroditum]
MAIDGDEYADSDTAPLQMSPQTPPLGDATAVTSSTALLQAEMTESAPGNVSHKPKSIISRKLRKFASETSFSAAPVRADIDLEASSSPVRQVATRTRVFTVRTVNNVPPRNGGSAVIRAATRRSRQDSDDASGSLASDATVVSSTVATPQARHKIKRFRLKRPKSAGNMGQNSYSSINNNETSYTSATIHSLDSLQPLQTHLENERRPSNVYMIDDDSTHEFDEDMTGNSLIYLVSTPFNYTSLGMRVRWFHLSLVYNRNV